MSSEQDQRPPTTMGDPPNRAKEFIQYLDRNKVALQRFLTMPRSLSPEERAHRFMTALWRTVRDTPALLECDRESLIGAAFDAARLGLEPGAAEGLCYLIPRKGVANLEIGYQGHVRMLYQHDLVAMVDAAIVHQEDHFVFVKGLNPVLEHTPEWKRDRGERTGAWALVKLANGNTIFEFMPRLEIEAIRDQTPGTDKPSSPWQRHASEMWRKTVLKRVAKYAPRSSTAREALSLEERSAEGVYDPRTSWRDAQAGNLMGLPAPDAAQEIPRPTGTAPEDEVQERQADPEEREPAPSQPAAQSAPQPPPQAGQGFPQRSEFQ